MSETKRRSLLWAIEQLRVGRTACRPGVVMSLLDRDTAIFCGSEGHTDYEWYDKGTLMDVSGDSPRPLVLTLDDCTATDWTTADDRE